MTSNRITISIREIEVLPNQVGTQDLSLRNSVSRSWDNKAKSQEESMELNQLQ